MRKQSKKAHIGSGSSDSKNKYCHLTAWDIGIKANWSSFKPCVQPMHTYTHNLNKSLKKRNSVINAIQTFWFSKKQKRSFLVSFSVSYLFFQDWVSLCKPDWLLANNSAFPDSVLGLQACSTMSVSFSFCFIVLTLCALVFLLACFTSVWGCQILRNWSYGQLWDAM